MNGLEVTRQIKTVAPSAEILLLSEHDLLPMVREGLRAGARYSTTVRTGFLCGCSHRALQGRKWDRCSHGGDRSGGFSQCYKLRIVGFKALF
jgi:DNA-binding NarL/FixJ family response regulator